MPPSSRPRRPKNASSPPGFPLSAELQPAGALKKRQEQFERELEERHREQAAQFRERAELTHRAYRPLFESLAQNRSHADEAAVKRLRASQARRTKQRLSKPPKPRPVEAGAAFGSLTQTFVPPYDFEWAPQSTTGSPTTSVGANRETGQGAVTFTTDFDDASSLDAWAGVGVFWALPSGMQSSASSGTLKLSADIFYDYKWSDDCLTDSVWDFGQIVLNVDEFTWDGEWVGLPVNQGSVLWNDSSWWSGSSGSAVNTNFNMTAQTQVDDAHFYNIWMFVNCQASADGNHSAGPFWFWYSDAWANIYAQLNSLTLSFG